MSTPEVRRRMADSSGTFTGLRFSEFIDFDKFRRDSRKLFLYCLLLSAFVHLLGLVFIPVQRLTIFHEKKETPPWTVVGEIIVLPPPAVNPYDTWKRDLPSRRMNRTYSEMIRHRTGPVMPSGGISVPGLPDGMRTFGKRDFLPFPSPSSLDTPGTDRAIRPEDPGFPEVHIPDGVERGFGISSLKEEMLTLEDLDNSQFMGIVVSSPGNLQAIRGIIHLPLAVWGTNLKPAVEARRAIDGFTGFLKGNSLIKPVIDPPVYLDSPRLLEYPFIYITAEQSFDLTPLEKRNLGDYLRNGGFAFIEAYGEMVRDEGEKKSLYDRGMYSNIGLPDWLADRVLTERLNAKFSAPLIAVASMRQMLRDALGAQGKLAPIPRDHALYHCFYDFDSPPAMDNRFQTFGKQPVGILEGITIHGRLVAVISEKQYGMIWKEFGNPNPPKDIPIDNMGKMGINILVMSLLQKGGLAIKMAE